MGRNKDLSWLLYLINCNISSELPWWPHCLTFTQFEWIFVRAEFVYFSQGIVTEKNEKHCFTFKWETPNHPFLNSITLTISLTVSFEHSICRFKGQAANARDEEPTWERCVRAQAHTRAQTHTGQTTNHLIYLHNKVIALLDTWDEIWVRFRAAPGYVSWQLPAHLRASRPRRYQSPILMEPPLLLQGNRTICGVLALRNPHPRNLGTFVCKSLQ